MIFTQSKPGLLFREVQDRSEDHQRNNQQRVQ